MHLISSKFDFSNPTRIKKQKKQQQQQQKKNKHLKREEKKQYKIGQLLSCTKMNKKYMAITI